MTTTPAPDRAATPDSPVATAVEPDAGVGGTLPNPPGPRDERALAFFKALNRWFMVPAVRAGLGPWVSTPIGGYMVLLRVRGRRTGMIRETPLNYVIADGSAWVMAGFGPATEWYRNLLADPEVEVVLPGRPPVRALAHEVSSPAVRARVIPAIIRSTAGPSLASGLRPWSSDDARMLEATAWVPLVRLTPLDDPFEAGADDPGGRAWIWRQGLAIAGSLLAAVLLLRTAGAVRRRAP